VTTNVPSMLEVITDCRSTLFGQVARLEKDVLAHKALHCHIDLAVGWPPNNQWKRRVGRPWERWIDQVRKDSGFPPADLWRHAISRGLHGATLQPLPAPVLMNEMACLISF